MVLSDYACCVTRLRTRSTARGLLEELARHGYRLSAGTLYPMLHGMEKKGYLRSREKSAGRSVRRLYRATPKGVRALAVVKDKLRELAGELIEKG